MNDAFIWYYVLLCGLLFFSSVFLTKLFIKYSAVHKILALPNERTLHKSPIPTGGGIVFALLHIIFLLLAIYGLDENFIKESIYKLCFGGLLVVILGVLDDKHALKAKQKLFFQILIALLMIFLGFNITQVTNPLGNPFYINYLSFPITILWYLLVMNAINLIDGLDGLAAGITIITCLVLLFFSYHFKNFLVFINSAFLVCTLLGFLRYNYSPAKLFMGDTGSLFIGYLIASLAIAGNETQFKGLTTFTLLVPLTVIFIPLIDALFTVIRRLKNRQYIFQADKKHLHHKLLDKGFSHKTVTLICWFTTLILGLIALGYIFVDKQIMLFILAFIGIIMLILFFYIYKKELFK
ncbi:MAG: undecaprenyl/decaprenyl-phosphate alpha-N-acetylglucosaminyl 1-phosphate transferase [Candidatus Cloacimonetes bacterium]|nr:undecaprenyl/decaprenyl-phosphate alpha-N-acetylglucosaminyl 1-phosphate transferase [Candidatus Cloacimonadota bacterium]